MSDDDHGQFDSAGRKNDAIDKELELFKEVPVCPHCLRPCHPLTKYCENCGANEPIDPLGPYMPLEGIRFNYGGFGKMWRKIFQDKDTSALMRVAYFLWLLLFFPVFVVIVLPAYFIGRVEDPVTRRILYFIFFAMLVFLYLLNIWRT